MKRRAQCIKRHVWIGLVVGALVIFSLLSTAQADNILKQKTIFIDKSKFWDLELYSLSVNNTVFTAGQSGTIHVKAGKKVTIKCKYGIKTIKPSLITEQDVEKWGAGNIAYRVAMGADLVVNKKIYTKFLPKFDMSTVSSYGNAPYMQWIKDIQYTWTPKMSDVGKEGFMALCTVDNKNDIKEYKEHNNSFLDVGPNVAIIIVTNPLTERPSITQKTTTTKEPLVPKVLKKVVTCQGSTATIIGTDGDDSIIGTPDRDVIQGLGGNDVIYGGTGNDLICGGDGEDKLYGETGDDDLFGEAGNDKLYGGANNDDLHGGAGNDELNGGTGDNYLLGGPGDDTMYGISGDDTLDGQAGNDKLIGGPGVDYLVGEEGNDTLDGGDGTDTLVGGDGDDMLDGGPRFDRCSGGPGSDTHNNCEKVYDP